MATIFTDLKTRLFRNTFRTRRSTTIIVGVNALARLLATELEAAGKAVSVIDLESGALAAGDEGDRLLLAHAGANASSCVMATTPIDVWNLSLCRMARLSFSVPTVIARLGLLGGDHQLGQAQRGGNGRDVME